MQTSHKSVQGTQMFMYLHTITYRSHIVDLLGDDIGIGAHGQTIRAVVWVLMPVGPDLGTLEWVSRAPCTVTKQTSELCNRHKNSYGTFTQSENRDIRGTATDQ